MTQRIIPIDSPNFLSAETLERQLDLVALFGNDRPLALEIGCGTGHFIVELAQRQPQTNFLAIDIYNKGCLKTCRKLDSSGLGNVWVLRVEARQLLFHGLQPASLSAVYINCPDPWPKKRHRQRRLVNREFLEILGNFLTPDGELFFATDVVDYARDVAAALRDLDLFRNRLDREISLDLPGYPSSKYMQRFLQLGQPIYYQHRQRIATTPYRQLDGPLFQHGFRNSPPRVVHG
ncbi:MAG: tRNA (guanosine(46)-N7)-methyltransferase TrmB [Desulfuromonadales bacterium]|nr:tRNA (guanosine(46)-N7)-methyltransferase TrmB [Desulfuromonadales bacterium]